MEVYSWENHGKSTITAINDGVLASHVWLRGCIHPIVSLSHSHNAPIQLGSVMEQSHVLWEDLDYIRIPRDSHQFIDGFYSHFVRIPMAWDGWPSHKYLHLWLSKLSHISYPHFINSIVGLHPIYGGLLSHDGVSHFIIHFYRIFHVKYTIHLGYPLVN